MMEPIGSKVASPVWWAIALHLDVQPEEVSAQQELRRDLKLDDLDLALIAMRVADWVGVDVPLATIERAVTVGDLARAVSAMVAELDEDERPSALPIRPPSGTRQSVTANEATCVLRARR